jgi:tetrahydromethanopterin S-methyltransferase subunit C
MNDLITDRNLKLVMAVLILLLIWNAITDNIVIIFLIAVVFILNIFFIRHPSNTAENFDRTGVVFVPLGALRYDLRGVPLRTRPIYDCRRDCFGDCYDSNI